MNEHAVTEEAGRVASPECTAVAQVIGRLGRGGAQRVAFNLALGLARLDADAMAIALREGGDYADGKAGTGVETHVLEMDPARWGTMLRGVRRLRALVRGRGIGVLHVHGADCLPVVYLATRGLRPPPRVVFTWHDSHRVLKQRGWRRRLMLAALRRCAAVSGSSRQVTERLGAAIGDGRPVGVLRNGVPTCPEVSRPAGATPPRIVWVGRLVPDKAPLAVLGACAALLEQGRAFRLQMIGDAPVGHEAYGEHVRGYAREGGLSDHVSFAGWVQDVAGQLAGADIAVQSSCTEGLSMALLEQMMAGLAIVATDVGDTAEALDGGRGGLLVPPNDESALREALQRLIDEPTLRGELAAAARQRAVEHYSLEAMARQAMTMYGAQPTEALA